jgi:hypothetical protein
MMDFISTAPTITQKTNNRAILIGDSLLGNYKKQYNVNSTSGFVVSGGVATINTSTAGNNNAVVGNYVNIQCLSATGLANPLSGTIVKVTEVVNSTTFKFLATYGGQTLADGDYSTIGGAQWSVSPLTQTQSNSWFPWMNAYLGSPFTLVSNFAMGGTTSSDSVTILSKIFAGPAFDYAFIGFGTNDINSASTAALANAAVTTVYNNFVTMVTAMMNYGARPVIAIPPPIGSTFNSQPAATTTFKNVALLNLREKLLELARTDSRITCIDLMKTMMLGTSATGDFISGYVNTSATDSVHPSQTACIALAKNEINAGTWYTTPIKINDRQPVSIIDDYQNNTAASSGAVTPNILQNGLFKGTAGTGISGIVTGTAPDNWSIQGPTGTAIASVGGATRTAISSTAAAPWGASNAANWGYAWTLSASGTAANQGYTLQSTAYTSLLQVGSWYQFGITVKALADLVNMRAIVTNFFFGSGLGNGYFLDLPSSLSTTNDALNMKSGDVIQLTSAPYYLPVAVPTGSALIQVVVQSIAAGWSANLEFSSAYVRAVPNPYA